MPGKLEVRRGYFTEEQLARFLAAARDEKELLWWQLMCDCGLRLGEVRSLLLYTIERNQIRICGKGSKWRTVPVTARVWETVVDVRSKRERFPDCRVCAVSARAVQARFHRCRHRAGLDNVRLCPHSLRHTFATRCLTAGIDIYRVGLLLGHRSIRTTVGYLHTNPKELLAAGRALDDLNKSQGSGD